MRRGAVVIVILALGAGGACSGGASGPQLPPVEAAANPTAAHALVDAFWTHLDSYRSGVDTEVGLAVWLGSWIDKVKAADMSKDITPDVRDHMLMVAEVTKDLVAPAPDNRARADAVAAVKKWSRSIYKAPAVNAVTAAEVGPAIEAEIVNLHMMIDGVPVTSDRRAEFEHRAAFPTKPAN